MILPLLWNSTITQALKGASHVHGLDVHSILLPNLCHSFSFGPSSISTQSVERMASLSNAIAALALILLDGADAFWRMNCAVVQTGRIDPLVNPGAVSAHVHTIVGGSSKLHVDAIHIHN